MPIWLWFWARLNSLMLQNCRSRWYDIYHHSQSQLSSFAAIIQITSFLFFLFQILRFYPGSLTTIARCFINISYPIFWRYGRYREFILEDKDIFSRYIFPIFYKIFFADILKIWQIYKALKVYLRKYKIYLFSRYNHRPGWSPRPKTGIGQTVLGRE